jgi:hypothetical protein
VAVLLRDAAGFEQYAALFKKTFSAAANPALAAKFHKLTREARNRADTRRSSGSIDADDELATSRAISMLETCQGAAERAECALSWLAQSSGVRDGYLFLLTSEGASCVARLGDEQPPTSVHSMADHYLEVHQRQSTTQTETSTPETMVDSNPGSVQQTDSVSESGIYRLVLLSHWADAGMAVTGVAVLVVPPGTHFLYPTRLATELSKRIEQWGDVTRVIVAP